MAGFFDFFTRDEFLPHAYCLVEQPGLIRLHIAADATTAAAYYSIPVALAYFAHRRREDIPFSWIFLLFGAFILLCGTTHLFAIWTLYVPDYYTEGLIKAATGLASIGTAIVTWKLMPALLLLPGPEKLRQLNSELEALVSTRTEELRAALAEKELLLRQAHQRAAIVDSSDDAIVAFDRAGRVTEWNHAAERLFGRPADQMIGRQPAEAAPGAFALADEFARLARGSGAEAFDVSADQDGRRLELSVRASPVRDPTGERLGVSVIARDIGDRLRTEQRLRTVMREVDHRAKNMLAIVMAMIRLTRHDPACDEFVAKIQGRIEALAAAHSAIVENEWDGAGAAAVAQRSLKPFMNDGQIAVSGEDAFLAPAAVQALGIVLHELATNAVKHGSLAAPEGRVFLHIGRTDAGDVTLAWTERGTGPAREPERGGFGMQLIRTHLRAQLDGATALTFGPDGLAAVMTVPKAFVVQPAGRPKSLTP